MTSRAESATGNRGADARPDEPAARALGPEVLAERREDDAWEQDLLVPGGLACWPGHFPARPIVPGVLQLDWVMRLAGRWLGAEPRLERIEALKFKQILGPGERFTLRLEADADRRRFHFHLSQAATVYAVGRFVLVGPEESRR